jgi:hypothetical protein
MGVDVDVGDPPDAVLLAQVLDRDAAVVEYAKARGDVAARVVQAGENARRNSPFMMRSIASVTEPATWLAASNMPTKDGVSPQSR